MQDVAYDKVRQEISNIDTDMKQMAKKRAVLEDALSDLDVERDALNDEIRDLLKKEAEALPYDERDQT